MVEVQVPSSKSEPETAAGWPYAGKRGGWGGVDRFESALKFPCLFVAGPNKHDSFRPARKNLTNPTREKGKLTITMSYAVLYLPNAGASST